MCKFFLKYNKFQILHCLYWVNLIYDLNILTFWLYIFYLYKYLLFCDFFCSFQSLHYFLPLQIKLPFNTLMANSPKWSHLLYRKIWKTCLTVLRFMHERFKGVSKEYFMEFVYFIL